MCASVPATAFSVGRTADIIGAVARRAPGARSINLADRARPLVEFQYDLTQFHSFAVFSFAPAQSGFLRLPERAVGFSADALAGKTFGAPCGTTKGPGKMARPVAG